MKRWISRLKSKLKANNSDHKVSIETQYTNLLRTTLSRSLASSQDYNVILPLWTPTQKRSMQEVKIGLYGNMANNLYIFAKCFQRLGFDAELNLQSNFIDNYVMNRPFWEDVAVECQTVEEGYQHQSSWSQPDFVHDYPHDAKFGSQFANRLSAITEVQELYEKEFQVRLPEDRAYLLAQNMSHWPLLQSMKKYDIVQLSSAAIFLGPFCPKPYVVFPTGGDLHISPFEETWMGMLYRAGYLNASGWLLGDSGYPEYLKRMGLQEYQVTPMIVDDEIYTVRIAPETRAEWQQAVGGNHFILMACRQHWEWKGNDVFIRQFAKVHKEFPEWRVVFSNWGPDIEASKALIRDCGLEQKIHWVPLSSKSRLRDFQCAADLVVDHCMDYGYGTTVLESMAAGKPVLMRTRQDHSQFLGAELPMISYSDNEQIPEVLRHWLSRPDELQQKGQECRKWVVQIHGQRVIIPKIMDYYERILRQHRIIAY